MSSSRSDLSLFESLPADVRILIMTHFNILSLADMYALAATSKENYKLFAGPGPRPINFWTRASETHFGRAYPATFDAPSAGYRALMTIENERRRVLAYTEILMTSDERPEVEPIEFLKRRHDRLEMNPETYLARQLLLREYKSFLMNSASILHDAPCTKEVQDQKEVRQVMINEAIDGLFRSDLKNTEISMTVALDCMDKIIHENELHLPSTVAGAMATILSVLGKCGAFHLLHDLISKLDPLIKQRFINSCGANICRDAAMFGHANMVRLLCENKPGVFGVSANARATHCLLFDEYELLLLPSTLKSLESLLSMRELRTMNPHQRQSLFTSFVSVLETLIEFGASPDLVREGHAMGFLGAQVLIMGNSLHYASDMLKKLPASLIPQKELVIINNVLEMIGKCAKEETKDERIANRKVGRHQFDFESSYEEEDDEDSDLKSPKKKTKSSEGENERADFEPSSPEPMDIVEDEEAFSPARRFGGLGLGD